MDMTGRWADKQKNKINQKNNENHRGQGGNCPPPPWRRAWPLTALILYTVADPEEGAEGAP